MAENNTTNQQGIAGNAGKIFTLHPQLTTDSPRIFSYWQSDRSHKYSSVFFRTYAPLDKVKELCVNLFEAYALIVHDRDVTADGNLKEVHIHVVGRAPRTKGWRVTNFVKFVEETKQATFIQLPISLPSAYEYLTHKNNPEKTQYPTCDIIEHNPDGIRPVSITVEQQKRVENEQFFEDLQQLGRRELAYKYGRDYMKNSRIYHSFVDDTISAEELHKLGKATNELRESLAQLPTYIRESETAERKLGAFLARSLLRERNISVGSILNAVWQVRDFFSELDEDSVLEYLGGEE